MRPVRRLRPEPAFHEVGPAARALRRFGGDGRPAAAHAADSQFPHDVHHLVAADLGRIPAPRQQPGARLAVPVHGHEEIGMDLEDAAGQRLTPGGHAADGPGSEHAVAARRDEPAVQRSGQRPADRPDPETVLEFVDVSDHQRRVGSSRAAKKADAVVNISFARLNRATSARELFTPPSRLRPTAWSPPRPWRPSCCANGAASPARPPDPWRPVRSPWSPTNTSRATRSTA